MSVFSEYDERSGITYQEPGQPDGFGGTTPPPSGGGGNVTAYDFLGLGNQPIRIYDEVEIGDDGQIYLIDRTTGDVTLGGQIPQGASTNVYTVTRGNTLIGIDRNTGRELWSYELPSTGAGGAAPPANLRSAADLLAAGAVDITQGLGGAYQLPNGVIYVQDQRTGNYYPQTSTFGDIGSGPQLGNKVSSILESLGGTGDFAAGSQPQQGDVGLSAQLPGLTPEAETNIANTIRTTPAGQGGLGGAARDLQALTTNTAQMNRMGSSPIMNAVLRDPAQAAQMMKGLGYSYASQNPQKNFELIMEGTKQRANLMAQNPGLSPVEIQRILKIQNQRAPLPEGDLGVQLAHGGSLTHMDKGGSFTVKPTTINTGQGPIQTGGVVGPAAEASGGGGGGARDGHSVNKKVARPPAGMDPRLARTLYPEWYASLVTPEQEARRGQASAEAYKRILEHNPNYFSDISAAQTTARNPASPPATPTVTSPTGGGGGHTLGQSGIVTINGTTYSPAAAEAYYARQAQQQAEPTQQQQSVPGSDLMGLPPPQIAMFSGGPDLMPAYSQAVANGFTGTFQDWVMAGRPTGALGFSTNALGGSITQMASGGNIHVAGQEFGQAAGIPVLTNPIRPLAGGGSMTISEPSMVTGMETGTPYATISERNPFNGAAQPEALTGAQVTPLTPNPVAPDGTQANPPEPSAFGLLLAQMLGSRPPRRLGKPFQG